jgi:hypothetical protein
VLDTGDGFTYPRTVGVKGAAHLFKAMQALHGGVDPDRFVCTLAELLGGPHWSAVANALTDELEADPGLLGLSLRSEASEVAETTEAELLLLLETEDSAPAPEATTDEEAAANA